MRYEKLIIVYAEAGRGALVRGADSEAEAIEAYLAAVGPEDQLENVGARQCGGIRDAFKALSKYGGNVIDA